jgi:hypothetical protein
MTAVETEAGGNGGKEIDDDLQSIVTDVNETLSETGSVSGISGITTNSAASGLSVASAASYFSVNVTEQHVMTADERRIARHADRTKKKQGKKRIKAGNPHEEEHLLTLIAQMTPLPRHKTKLHALCRVLLQLSLPEYARTLQTAAVEWYNTVKQEEQRPMPVLDTMSASQQAKLHEYWNWPQSSYKKEEVVDDEPFSFLISFQGQGVQSLAPTAEEDQETDDILGVDFN